MRGVRIIAALGIIGFIAACFRASKGIADQFQTDFSDADGLTASLAETVLHANPNTQGGQ